MKHETVRISQAVVVGPSEADHAAAPAEAKVAPAELRAADPAPAQAADRQAMAQPAAANGLDAGAPPRSLRRLIIPIAAVGAAAALALVTSARWNAWVGAAAVQTTDNATVHAEMSRLSARVSGNVRRVVVQDFQRVKAGELLMEIEPADYDAIVAQATASVAAAQAVLHNLENQKAHQRAVIAQAEAQRKSALARELETRQELERQDQLLRGGTVALAAVAITVP